MYLTLSTFNLLTNGWHYSVYTLKWIAHFRGAGSQHFIIISKKYKWLNVVTDTGNYIQSLIFSQIVTSADAGAVSSVCASRVSDTI